MSPAPSVRCSGCGFSWNSSAMADGLRVLGSCPKCNGDLMFREQTLQEDRFESTPSASRTDAPHLVLGIPRR
jgi:hypothetical protein